MLIQAEAKSLRRPVMFIPPQGGLDERPGFGMVPQEMPGYARDPLTSGQSLMIFGISSKVHHLRGMRQRFRVSAAAKGVEPKTVMRLELGLRIRYPMRKIERPSPSCSCLG